MKVSPIHLPGRESFITIEGGCPDIIHRRHRNSWRTHVPCRSVADLAQRSTAQRTRSTAEHSAAHPQISSSYLAFQNCSSASQKEQG